MPKLYTLNKQQVGDAIVRYIGIFIENQSFFPYKIKRVSKERGQYILELEYIPKGTKKEEAKHAL